MAIARPTPATAGVCALFALILQITGCAAPQTARLAHEATDLPRQVLLSHVPFFPQEQFQCGPASLAMALNTSGIATTPEALQQQVYLPAREGSLQSEMLATARRVGRLAVTLPPRLAAVLTEVADGRPVIVLQNLSLPITPVWHYAVVIGYDLDRAAIVLHTGVTEHERMPLPVFERTWARSDHWAMVADAPDRLPRSPVPEALIAAAIALERVDPAAARGAYAALTRRAPGAPLAWVGLGNTAYAAHDYQQAAAAFQHAADIDAQSADAWNNLAQALLALGRPRQARAAAERAIALGGPRLARYQATLTSIEDGIR